MAKSNSKQRLFEVMSKTDKTFKPKLNENLEEAGYGKDTNIVHYYYRVIDVTYAVHGGGGQFEDIKEALDSAVQFALERFASVEVRLIGVNDDDDQIEEKTVAYIDYKAIEEGNKKIDSTRGAKVAHERETDEYRKTHPNPFEKQQPPITEKMIGKKPKGKRDDVAYYKGAGIFPEYTHFAVIKADMPYEGGVLKTANKIINGWDYRGYDSDDLKSDRQWYFTQDIKDMDISPKLVQVVTAPYLKKRGIDPYDQNNWMKTEEMSAWMKAQY